jgi:hypothetical protein
MGAFLVKAFGLPIPNFHIAYIDRLLVESHSSEAIEYLGVGDVFVSEQIKSATEFKYHILKNINLELQQAILVFDLWLQNSDRTFSEGFSGNPNLIWGHDAKQLYVIDHNLAFETVFDKTSFWETHVCRSQFLMSQLDIDNQFSVESSMQNAIKNWSTWWNQVPDEWKEQNENSKSFDADTILERLKRESQGEIWAKWL